MSPESKIPNAPCPKSPTPYAYNSIRSRSLGFSASHPNSSRNARANAPDGKTNCS